MVGEEDTVVHLATSTAILSLPRMPSDQFLRQAYVEIGPNHLDFDLNIRTKRCAPTTLEVAVAEAMRLEEDMEEEAIPEEMGTEEEGYRWDQWEVRREGVLRRQVMAMGILLLAVLVPTMVRSAQVSTKLRAVLQVLVEVLLHRLMALEDLPRQDHHPAWANMGEGLSQVKDLEDIKGDSLQGPHPPTAPTTGGLLLLISPPTLEATTEGHLLSTRVLALENTAEDPLPLSTRP